MSSAVRADFQEIEGGKIDLLALMARVDARLQASGSDGGGGMEVRVAKLESDVEHMKRDVNELRGDMRDVRDRLTRIETRVDHLPSKGFVVTSLVVTLTVMTAVITFQDRIQRFVRQVPPAVIAAPIQPAP